MDAVNSSQDVAAQAIANAWWPKFADAYYRGLAAEQEQVQAEARSHAAQDGYVGYGVGCGGDGSGWNEQRYGGGLAEYGYEGAYAQDRPGEDATADANATPAYTPGYYYAPYGAYNYTHQAQAEQTHDAHTETAAEASTTSPAPATTSTSPFTTTATTSTSPFRPYAAPRPRAATGFTNPWAPDVAVRAFGRGGEGGDEEGGGQRAEDEAHVADGDGADSDYEAEDVAGNHHADDESDQDQDQDYDHEEDYAHNASSNSGLGIHTEPNTAFHTDYLGLGHYSYLASSRSSTLQDRLHSHSHGYTVPDFTANSDDPDILPPIPPIPTLTVAEAPLSPTLPHTAIFANASAYAPSSASRHPTPQLTSSIPDLEDLASTVYATRADLHTAETQLEQTQLALEETQSSLAEAHDLLDALRDTLASTQSQLDSLTSTATARAANARRQWLGMRLLPVANDHGEPPFDSLPAIRGRADIARMGDGEVAEWVAYYNGFCPPVGREGMERALCACIGVEWEVREVEGGGREGEEVDEAVEVEGDEEEGEEEEEEEEDEDEDEEDDGGWGRVYNTAEVQANANVDVEPEASLPSPPSVTGPDTRPGFIELIRAWQANPTYASRGDGWLSIGCQGKCMVKRTGQGQDQGRNDDNDDDEEEAEDEDDQDGEEDEDDQDGGEDEEDEEGHNDNHEAKSKSKDTVEDKDELDPEPQPPIQPSTTTSTTTAPAHPPGALEAMRILSLAPAAYALTATAPRAIRRAHHPGRLEFAPYLWASAHATVQPAVAVTGESGEPEEDQEEEAMAEVEWDWVEVF